MSRDSFIAQDYSVDLWGVAALRKAMRLHLHSKQIRPAVDDRNIMHCLIDGQDVGSLIVQMGMAATTEDYYQHEQEEEAKQQGRGIWKQEVG